MHFESAAGIWFALALPAIVLLYLFKRKYIDTPVSSHLLWNRALKELEANRPWQKLRSRLIMIVQLLAAALLVLALMQPWVWSEQKAKAHAVVVLDRSASMTALADPGAGGGTETKLDAAKRRILEWAEREAAGSAITLIAMGERPEAVLSRETDRSKLRETLAGIVPAHGETAYKAALSLASALTRSDPDSEVRVFTDGQFTEPVTGLSFAVPISVERIGAADAAAEASAPNVSISQFGVGAARDRGVTAVVTLRNWGKTDVQTELAVYAGAELAEVRSVSVSAGGQASVYFSGMEAADWYKAELEANDSMRLDDVQYAFLAGDRPKKALLISEGNLFLEKAMQLAGAEVTKLSPDSAEAWLNSLRDFEAPDIAVIESDVGTAAASEKWRKLLGSIPAFYIGSGYPGTDVSVPSRAYTVEEHPVTRYISFQDTHFAAARRPDSVTWGEPVLSAGNLPLIYAGTENGQPRLLFAFSLAQTDLALRSEFPVLIQNALEWLTASRFGSLGKAVAGQPMEIALAPRTETAVWEKADAGWFGGSPAQSAGSASAARSGGVGAGDPGKPAFAPAEAGLYRLVERDENGEIVQSRWLAVTADPRESGEPPAEVPLVLDAGEAGAVADPASPANQSGAPYEIWKWFALVALAVIVWEWEVYRRGAAV